MMTLLALFGLTATPVSFCDWARPRKPAALWFVQSDELARTLVAEASGHPATPPEPARGASAAGTLFGSFDRETAVVGSTLTTPEGANRFAIVGAVPFAAAGDE